MAFGNNLIRQANESICLFKNESSMNPPSKAVSFLLAGLPQLSSSYVHVLKCNICEYLTLATSNLKEHFRLRHPFSSGFWTYSCFKCSSMSTEKTLMEEHMNLYHRLADGSAGKLIERFHESGSGETVLMSTVVSLKNNPTSPKSVMENQSPNQENLSRMEVYTSLASKDFVGVIQSPSSPSNFSSDICSSDASSQKMKENIDCVPCSSSIITGSSPISGSRRRKAANPGRIFPRTVNPNTASLTAHDGTREFETLKPKSDESGVDTSLSDSDQSALERQSVEPGDESLNEQPQCKKPCLASEHNTITETGSKFTCGGIENKSQQPASSLLLSITPDASSSHSNSIGTLNQFIPVTGVAGNILYNIPNSLIGSIQQNGSAAHNSQMTCTTSQLTVPMFDARSNVPAQTTTWLLANPMNNQGTLTAAPTTALQPTLLVPISGNVSNFSKSTESEATMDCSNPCIVRMSDLFELIKNVPNISSVVDLIHKAKVSSLNKEGGITQREPQKTPSATMPTLATNVSGATQAILNHLVLAAMVGTATGAKDLHIPNGIVSDQALDMSLRSASSVETKTRDAATANQTDSINGVPLQGSLDASNTACKCSVKECASSSVSPHPDFSCSTVHAQANTFPCPQLIECQSTANATSDEFNCPRVQPNDKILANNTCDIIGHQMDNEHCSPSNTMSQLLNLAQLQALISAMGNVTGAIKLPCAGNSTFTPASLPVMHNNTMVSTAQLFLAPAAPNSTVQMNNGQNTLILPTSDNSASASTFEQSVTTTSSGTSATTPSNELEMLAASSVATNHTIPGFTQSPTTLVQGNSSTAIPAFVNLVATSNRPLTTQTSFTLNSTTAARLLTSLASFPSNIQSAALLQGGPSTGQPCNMLNLFDASLLNNTTATTVSQIALTANIRPVSSLNGTTAKSLGANSSLIGFLDPRTTSIQLRMGDNTTTTLPIGNSATLINTADLSHYLTSGAVNGIVPKSEPHAVCDNEPLIMTDGMLCEVDGEIASSLDSRHDDDWDCDGNLPLNSQGLRGLKPELASTGSSPNVQANILPSAPRRTTASSRSSNAAGSRRNVNTSGLDSPQPSRPHRQNFTPTQNRILTEWYQVHQAKPYPSTDDTKELANESGLSYSQVKKWFANKRARSSSSGLPKPTPPLAPDASPDPAATVAMVAAAMAAATSSGVAADSSQANSLYQLFPNSQSFGISTSNSDIHFLMADATQINSRMDDEKMSEGEPVVLKTAVEAELKMNTEDSDHPGFEQAVVDVAEQGLEISSELSASPPTLQVVISPRPSACENMTRSIQTDVGNHDLETQEACSQLVAD